MPNDVTLDPPITNIERLLAKAAGMENIDVDEPETRIERYLKAICDRLDSGGSQLPDPTENDVGKVATVVDNSGTYEYGLETPSSGGGVLVVNVTETNPAVKVPTRGPGVDDDPDPVGTVYLDKTWQEIFDAASNGVPAVMRVTDVDNIWFTLLSSVFAEAGTYYVDFGIEGINFDEYSANSTSGYPSKEL